MDIPENVEWKTPPALASLTEAQRAAALERFGMIRAHLEDGVLLTVLAISAGIPCRTLSRWVSLYRKGGLAELARRGRDDKGGRRGFSARILQAVEGLALRKPRLPVATICRKIRQLAEDLGEKPPGYKVIHGIIRKLPPDLMLLAHEGAKAHSEAFDLVHRQEAAGPNAVWQADHCLLDILIPQESGEPARPWLTIVIDDYSRAIAGYFLSFDAPSSIRTALALRQAIWRKSDPRWRICGIPEVLYTDNGSDFTSRHLEQVAADLKMRLVFSLERILDPLFDDDSYGYPSASFSKLRCETADGTSSSFQRGGGYSLSLTVSLRQITWYFILRFFYFKTRVINYIEDNLTWKACAPRIIYRYLI